MVELHLAKVDVAGSNPVSRSLKAYWIASTLFLYSMYKDIPVVKEKQIEHLDNSAVKLTVTVGQETVRTEYDNLLKEYAKDAQIKGFRKGKVPPSVLERKFGESIRYEASQKTLESSLRSVFEEIEEKPLPYCTPTLEDEPEFSLEKDLVFSVTYDIFPEITVGEYSGIPAEEPQVNISKEDEKRELEQIQEQNAVVVEKDDAKIKKEHIVTLNYEELDENDSPVDGSRREDFTFTIGTGYNLYKIDDDVIGLKKGDKKVISKSFPEDFENTDLAGTEKKISVEITNVKEKELPAIDDELAQDVSEKYETIDDLKNDIKNRLEKNLELKIRQIKIDQIMDALVDSSTVPVPGSMITAELDNSWQRFVHQFRTEEAQVLQLLQMQGKTKDELLEEWKPAAEKNLKRSLIMQKLIETEKIEVSDEELDAEIAEQAEQSGASLDEIKEYFTKQGMLPYLKQDLQERKAQDLLLSKAKIKKGKKSTYLDVVQPNQ